MRYCLELILLGISLCPLAQDYNYSLYTKVVPVVTVEGRRIARGMTHDDFVATVGFPPLSTTSEPDPMVRGSLHVFKRFREGGQQFLVEFKRDELSGPYRVFRIRLPGG